jgi:hypothetical protein
MGGGVRLRSPTPDRGSLKEVIEQAFPERSRMGAPLDSWRIFEFYGGWGSAPLTHPDRGHLKEIIKQAFPERSRMGAPLRSWKIIEFNGVGFGYAHPPPIEGISKKPLNRRSLSGVEWEHYWNH